MIMSMYSTNPIMTVAEARKIMGGDADKFSDEQLADIINDLDLLAKLAIKHIKNKGPLNENLQSIS